MAIKKNPTFAMGFFISRHQYWIVAASSDAAVKHAMAPPRTDTTRPVR
jgi:hypothetical protein